MTQIIKLTYNDDKDGSTSIEVMVCSSVDAAKEIIRAEICNGFDGVWNTLEEASQELSDELTCCVWDEDSKTFHWYDDGKGCTYIIGEVWIMNVNTKWQKFGNVG